MGLGATRETTLPGGERSAMHAQVHVRTYALISYGVHPFSAEVIIPIVT